MEYFEFMRRLGGNFFSSCYTRHGPRRYGLVIRIQVRNTSGVHFDSSKICREMEKVKQLQFILRLEYKFFTTHYPRYGPPSDGVVVRIRV